MIEPWTIGILLLPAYLIGVQWLGGKICILIAWRWPRVAEILQRVI